MKRHIPMGIALVALPLALGGCAGLQGTAAGLGIAALTSGAAFGGKAISEDIAQAAEFRGRHQALVDQVIAAMMARGRSLEDSDWDESVKAYEKALEFSLSNRPQILLRRLREQLKDDD